MGSLRKLVAALGGLAGAVGLLQVIILRDWLVLSPELTASPDAAPTSQRWLGFASGLLCLIGAVAIWRAPRLSAVVLSLGALGLLQGLGYTPYTLLPIGFAVMAAGLALVLALSDGA